jgi:PPOX class probable F420-dependent enzyme
MTKTEIEAFLNEPRTAALSTLDRDGSPHMAGMWFVIAWDAMEMWTYAKSQKAVNLRRDPRVAALVEEGSVYGELKGVLIKGSAELVDDFDAIAGIGRGLYERYTLPRTGVPVEVALGEIERQATKRIGIRLPMSAVASWDHSKI